MAPCPNFAIRWWRTQHPQPVIAGGDGSGLDPRMAATLWVCVAMMTIIFTYFFRRRVTLEVLRDERAAAEEGGG